MKIQLFVLITVFIFHSFSATEALEVENRTVTGVVLTPQGKPLYGANVIVSALKLGASTNKRGQFSIPDVPPGEYTLTVTYMGYAKKSISINLKENDVKLKVELKPTILRMPAVTITGSASPTDMLNSNRTVSVIDKQALIHAHCNSMSGALRNVPGIQIADQGPMIAKPMIRGMTNQRIVLLRDGVKHEAQQWSNHHTPEVDFFDAEKIEVLRGPGSLLYGSGAIGGVVHIISPKARTLEEGGASLGAEIVFQGFTNTEQAAGKFSLNGAGNSYGWRLDVSARKSQYYAVPGRNHFLVKQLDTGFEQSNYRGLFRMKLQAIELTLVAVNYWEEQQLIGEGHWHNSGGPDGGPWYHAAGAIKSPTIHQKVQLSGKTTTGASRLEFDISKQYDHRQGIPDGMLAQVDLEANCFDLNVKNYFQHALYPNTIGFSLSKKEDLTNGIEVLIPNSDVTNVGSFILQDFNNFKNIRISSGLRSDWCLINIKETELKQAWVDNYGRQVPAYIVGPEEKIFNSIFSGSLGIVWRKSKSPFSIAANIGTGWRTPTPVELYINGVHHASYEYMLGNENLTPEMAVNSDLIFRWANERVVSELSFFYNRIYDYIFANPTGGFYYINEFSNIPMYLYEQSNALLKGIEFRIQQRLSSSVRLEAGCDLIRGGILSTVIDADDDGKVEKNLPRIPPDRISGGITICLGDIFFFRNTHFKIDAFHCFTQNHLAEFENVLNLDADSDGKNDEIKSEGYTLINTGVDTEFSFSNRKIILSALIKNLTNTKYFSHLSNYKGIANNPGFDFSLMIKISL